MENTIKKTVKKQKAVKHIMHINTAGDTTLFFWALWLNLVL